MPPLLHRQAAPGRLRRPRRALPAPLRRRPQGQGHAVEPERRARLLAAKLRTRVEATAGPGDRRSVALPGGAALVGDDGTWVLADAEPARALGPALAVARQARGAGALHVVVEGDAGILARRATYFAEPPTVWQVEGAALRPAVAEPLPAVPPLDPRVAAFAGTISAAGADPVVEHGRLIAEVVGLEVARVVVDGDEPRLEVGVGRFDREAHALLAGDAAPGETLAGVVALVRQHRQPGAVPHPINRLAAARRLRARLVAEPGLVGADHLAPMAAVAEAPDLRTAWPAPAVGIDTHGNPVVVVASVGVDLDLVPTAADTRAAAMGDGAARLLLAVPGRDAHPVTKALAAALREPAEVITVPS